MPESEDLVTVAEAARLVATTRGRIHGWIRSGRLVAQQGRYGYLVSATAVRALGQAGAPPRPARGPREVPGDTAEYVPPSVAARLTGVQQATVSTWGRTGKVATRPGPYGRLV